MKSDPWNPEQQAALRRKLLERGADLRCPETIALAPDVDPDRIAPGVTIHPGCRLTGRDLFLGPGAVLGGEAPVTIENCQCGRNVELKGGFFCEATFLDGASLGSAAHVRPGTLLEEEAGGAHAVGFKQTILMPFVTTGSLVNLCDCLLAGGTSRRDHSEVGSSYVHFNFTPHGDKATPSRIGDVPRGVMLDQPPVFLGGQGGIVGPVRIGFGAVVAAGVIVREDLPDGRRIHAPPPPAGLGGRDFARGAASRPGRKARANLEFLGDLAALREWYREARARSLARDPCGTALLEGALRRIGQGIEERIRRLDDFARRLEAGPGPAGREAAAFLRDWPALRETIAGGRIPAIAEAKRDAFLPGWERALQGASSHVEAVRALPPAARAAGTAWLRAVADGAMRPDAGNSR